MNALSSSVTFPNGFLDFLEFDHRRGQAVGDYPLDPGRMQQFNAVLQRISAESPPLDAGQIASAAHRVLGRYRHPQRPAFVESRLQAMLRLESMAADPGWEIADEDRERIAVLRGYLDDPEGLIPDRLPVIGLLDDAVLVDMGLQVLSAEMADYEDYTRFCRVAADFAGVGQTELGLTRTHWLEARQTAYGGGYRGDRKRRYAPDPRASLFHIG